MEKKKVLILFLSIIIVLTSLNFSYGSSNRPRRPYEKWLEEVEDNSGEQVRTTKIAYNLKTKKGKGFYIEDLERTETEYDRRKGFDAIRNIPVSFETTVGDVLYGSDASISHYNLPIIGHDWQVSYYNENYEPYKEKHFVSNKKDIEVKLDKPGYVLVFKNSADAKRFKYQGTDKEIPFTNYSGTGNYVMKPGSGKNSLDWYFLATKIKVNGDNDIAGLRPVSIHNSRFPNGAGKNPNKPNQILDITGKEVSGSSGGPCVLKNSEQFVSFSYVFRGDDDVVVENPTFNIEIKDTDGNILLREKKVLNQPMKNNVPVRFNSKKFKVGNKNIIAKAVVDKKHKIEGVNEDESNDVLEETFVICPEKEVDIGVVGPIAMFIDGKQTNTITDPSKKAQFGINVKHFDGNRPVGEGKDNPKVIVDVEVRPKGSTIGKVNVQADKVLRPKETIGLPKTPPVELDSTEVEVCATISKIHKPLGYNHDPSNDRYCQTFIGEKNYAVSNLKVSPKIVHQGKDDDRKDRIRRVELEFDVSNKGFINNEYPEIEIRHNGKVIYRGKTYVPFNDFSTVVKSFNLDLKKGNNEFKVEVNPSKNPKEFIRSGNPYKDNIAKTNLLVREFLDCIDCEGVRTSNRWTEEFSWRERYNCRERRRKNGDTSCRCRRRSWSEEHDFYEKYYIENMFFRSKYTKDNKNRLSNVNSNGWQNLKNGGTGKIKAGYGFELMVDVRYKTNRSNLPAPHPYGSGGCSDSLTRRPGYNPNRQPDRLYMKMPYKDNAGKRVCYILRSTSLNGSSDNNYRRFELPTRKTPSGERARKIFINENAKPSKNNRIDFITPKWFGYSPNTPVEKMPNYDKRDMQDCKNINIEILQQDDFKTHIVQ